MKSFRGLSEEERLPISRGGDLGGAGVGDWTADEVSAGIRGLATGRPWSIL